MAQDLSLKFVMRIIFILTLLISFDVFACRPNQIAIINSSSFGLSVGGGGVSFNGGIKNKVEIPLYYENKSGCMTQESGLDFGVIENESKKTTEIRIYPPRVKFKKVPGKVKSFVKVYVNPENIVETKTEVVSFTCVGETVVAVESYNGGIENMITLRDIFSSQSSQSRGGFFLATGAAARIIHEREMAQKDRKLDLGYDTVLSEGFVEQIISKVKNEDIVIEEELVSTPSIILRSSLQVGSLNLDHSFTTLNATKFGCSQKFSELMDEYKIENLARTLKKEGIKVKKKRKYYEIKLKQ